jgi:hypothetical protein
MDDHERIIDRFTLGDHEYTASQFPNGDVMLQSELTSHPQVPGDAIHIPASAIHRLACVLGMAAGPPIRDSRQNVVVFTGQMRVTGGVG